MLYFKKLECLHRKLTIHKQLQFMQDFSGIIAKSILFLKHICYTRVLANPILLTIK